MLKLPIPRPIQVALSVLVFVVFLLTGVELQSLTYRSDARAKEVEIAGPATSGEDVPPPARQLDPALAEAGTERGLMIVFILCVPIALILGMFLASRYRQTLHIIGSTLTQVSRGRPEARIPVQGGSWGLGKISVKINDLLDEHQRLTQSLNHATAEIAHTLKRPLISLRRRLEHARENRLDRDQFAELIKESIAEIDSMMRMFEAILDIAQIEAGDIRSRFTEVDLKSVLLRIVEIYEPVIQDRGQTLVVNLAHLDETSVSGEADLLLQMFNNLVENAILYCPCAASRKLSRCEVEFAA